ncbi:MAG TPA: lipopolysaccharide biosynthesis protein [Verrucomicrobiae bacterium]|nr:lipopolysaccharide biosynthesis protein [Verrucomicrobiae bacterium]
MNQSAPISQPGAVAAEPNPAGGLGRIFGRQNAEQIKRKSVRGGAVTLVSQGFKFVLTTATTMVMARLLTPADFGLQGMIVAWTGIVGLFGDIGLSMATIQSDTVTHEQTSTLFWINVALGTLLALMVALLAPLLAAFNHEPRLFWMTLVVASTFLLGGLGVQHSALLVREMRFLALAKVQIASLVAGSLTGIAMAAYGCGYWALVGSMVAAPLVNVAGLWLSVRWLPGRPRRGFGLRSALHFGGILTLNNVVVYLGYNLEKVLLGRFWGADALGLYGRAYSLVNLPTTQLHNAVNTVAFPVFSRLQSEPARLRTSFLKVYATVVSLCIPVTLGCVLFAPEMIHIALGAQWDGAVPIFRLLGPTVLAFGMINPFGWFLISTGRVVRSFNISLLIAPAVILGILGGLHYGPKGVALAYSVVMTVLIVPVILWAIRGTGIRFMDILKSLGPAALSGLCAAAAGLGFNLLLGQAWSPVLRLLCGLGLVLAVDAGMLLWVMGQKAFFVDLVREMFQRGKGQPPET